MLYFFYNLFYGSETQDEEETFEIYKNPKCILTETMKNMCRYSDYKFREIPRPEEPEGDMVALDKDTVVVCNWDMQIKLLYPEKFIFEGVSGLRYAAKLMRLYPQKNAVNTAMVDEWIDRFLLFVALCTCDEEERKQEVLERLDECVKESETGWLYDFDAPTLADFLWIQVLKYMDKQNLEENFFQLAKYRERL